MIYKKINKDSNIASLFNKYRDQPLLLEIYTEEATLDVVTFLFRYKNMFLTLENLYLKNGKSKEVRCYIINYEFGKSTRNKKISKEEFINISSGFPDFSDWILFNINKIT